jgi:HlyD family secretion protein
MKWKIILGLLGLLVVAGGGYGAYRYRQAAVVTVQTGRVSRQDLTAVVTASGEIKPKTYINVGNNANIARITSIEVEEGKRVRKGQLLARLESVQPEADVAAQRAAVSTSEADSTASEASLRAADDNIRVAMASVERSKTDLERTKINFDRTKRLWDGKLIAQQEYDQKSIEVRAAEAAVNEAELRVTQLQAQKAQTAANVSASQRRVTQSQAQLRRIQDILQRTYVVSPIDGIVTNLPVRVGETVVPGVQNSSASLIMTIADMSTITAEVMVDETEIVNVKLGQPAEVTIEAIPNQTFQGHVIEIGNTAILRSTGQAASQSAVASQEAKDFKVVVALDSPPDSIRPGLSCSAKITTQTRKNALSLPLQSLTVRTVGDLDPKRADDKVLANEVLTAGEEKKLKEEIQGVFVMQGEAVVYKKVETGITGVTEIEITSGLNEGDVVVTGPYRAIRTVRDQTKVKVDNKANRAAS